MALLTELATTLEASAVATTSVAVADAETVFRIGLESLFRNESSFNVLEGLSELAAGLSRLEEESPDVLFISRQMLGYGAREALTDVFARSPETRVVVTAGSINDAEAAEMVRLGARGVILTSADPELFVKCVHKVVDGEIWLPKRQIAEFVRATQAAENERRPADTLTHRERLVVGCLVQGWRNREIAEHLAIREQTVKNHLRAIFDKVGVSDRLELLLYTLNHPELLYD